MKPAETDPVQASGPRSLDELKQETILRADRKVYPMTGVSDLFGLFDARSGVYGTDSLEEFLAYGPRMSLQARSLLGKPTAPMLLGGCRDTLVPIDDLYLLLNSAPPRKHGSIRTADKWVARNTGRNRKSSVAS